MAGQRAAHLLVGGLVSYSGSSSEEEEEDSTETLRGNVDCNKRSRADDTAATVNPKKMKKVSELSEEGCALPSVPAGIMKMFGDDTSVPVDDSTLHGGRIRSFAHERGNWATYIYAQVPESSMLMMRDLTETLVDVLMDLVDVEFQAITDLHLTLSRTLVLRHHWIEDLMNSLRGSLGRHKRLWCSLHRPRFYCNDEKTRTFLGLQVESGSDKLIPVVDTIDKCLSEYRLPSYYEDPSFHVSLAWAMGDVTNLMTDSVQEKLLVGVEDWLSSSCDAAILQVEELRCKTGNKIFSFPLG